MAKSIEVRGGRARLHPPTPSKKYWRVVWTDPVTLKRRMTSAGHSFEEAEQKAAEILGDSIREELNLHYVPTVSECFETFLNSQRSKWSSRTLSTYKQAGGKLLKLYGNIPVTHVRPIDMRKIDLEDLTREHAGRIRTVIRGTFETAKEHTKTDPDRFFENVIIPGSKSDKKPFAVQKQEIPTAQYVNGLIDVCFSSFQVHPTFDRSAYKTNPITGELETLTFGQHGWDMLKLGQPRELLDSVRHVIQKSYKDPDAFRAKETPKLAKRMRMVGTAFALTAATGIRVSELLPLRVSDLITVADTLPLMQYFRHDDSNLKHWKTRGKLEINKASGQASDGHMVLSPPKYSSTGRTVWIPAVMYSQNETGAELRKPRRQQVIDTGLERFKDLKTSLWEMTNSEALHLWKNGMIPVAWILMKRLQDLWDDLHKVEGLDKGANIRIDDFQNLLLFPTKGRPRKNQRIEIPKRWPHETKIVEGFGGYIPSNNFSKRYTNPVFDYVSEFTGTYPRGTIERKGRSSWSFHSMRHYFVTSNLYHGIPLPEVSRLAGHASIDFTLNRYAKSLEQDYSEMGFE